MQLDWLVKPKYPATRVLVCGTLGGVLGILRDAVDGGFEATWYLVIVQNLLMGACAAFVAIYVLLGSNTEDLLRTCGVALVAGYSWAPVFDAGKEYVLAQPERAAEATAAAETDALSRGTEKLEDGAADANLVRKTGQQAKSLSDQVESLRPGPVKTRALAVLGRSVDAISAKAGKDDEDALDSVGHVGEMAARSGHDVLSKRAWSSISKIPVTQGSQAETRKKEYKARFPGIR